jgi:RHS repeat-associated protein
MHLRLTQLIVVIICLLTSIAYGYSGSHAYNKASVEKISVNAATGTFDFSLPIISTHGIREPFELNLTYLFNRKGLFGLPQGWQLDLDYIDEKTANIHGQQWLIDPLWRDETLTASGLKYYNQHGSKFIDQIEAKPVPGFTDHTFRFVLKHNDGSSSYFSHQGLLVVKVDRFNNAMIFNYHQPVRSLESARLDSIIDNYGNKYQFIYAPNEMRVVMPDQRELVIYNDKDGIMKIVDPLKLHTDISYVKAFNRHLIKAIESPSGLFVSLTYSSINYKSGGIAGLMPVVDSLEKIDRATNKIIEQTHYKYSADNNFTGYPKYSLSDATDSLIDSNDQSYRYWVQITKSDLESPSKFHSQLFYYNYLHLPVDVYTLKEGRPYLKATYEYTISPFKYSRSTNYDKPKKMTKSLWSEAHSRFVDTERNNHHYDRYGKKTFENHEIFDRINSRWNKILTSNYSYYPHYSLKKNTIKTDHVTGQKIQHRFTLNPDKKTHQSVEISVIHDEKKLHWQPWQQEIFKFDTHGRKTYHGHQWLTKEYPGLEKTWKEFTYDFDTHSKQLTHSEIAASGAAKKTVIDTRNNQIIKNITPLNETWAYHYNALNQVDKSINPLGHITEHTYLTYQVEGVNAVVTASPLGYKFRKAFDAKHQQIHWHDFHDNKWRHLSSARYNGFGKVVEQTDINQLASITDYDSFDRPLSHVDYYGNKTEYKYDDFLLTTSIYLNKHKIYEKLSEPWNMLVRDRFYPNIDNPRDSLPDYVENAVKYSGFKKKIEETNSLMDRYHSEKKKSVTRFISYDARLNIIEEKSCGFDDTELSIKYTHDIFNHPVTKKKNLKNKETSSSVEGETFVYDIDGQLSQIQSAKLKSGEQQVTQFIYNKNGKKIKIILAGGQKISQSYNVLNLPEKISWSREGKPYEITNQYDEDKQLILSKNSQGQSLTFKYLDNGLLTQMIYPDGQSYQVEYDSKNRKIKEKALAGPVHHFHYDSKDLGKLSSINSDDLCVNYHYGVDDNDYKYQLIQRTFNHPKTGETVETITYGSQGIPVKSEVLNRKQGIVHEVNYAFNSRKQLTDLSMHSHKGHLIDESVDMHYNYNALNQLISEKLSNAGHSRELNYHYDANGNLTLEQELIDGKHSNKSFVYNAMDQLVQITSDFAPDNGALDYDVNGRMIKDHQGREYAYDDRGYLLSVNTPDGKIHYDYWLNGQLSQRKSTNSANQEKSTQFYQNHDKKIMAMNNSGDWHYLLKDNKGILASRRTNNSGAIDSESIAQWFMTNPIIGAVLTDAGKLSTRKYMAYGSPLQRGLSVPETMFGWHQDYTDTESGLVYLKSRFYSPSLKRFITPDSLLVDNRYRYAKSNPLFFYDPTGHNASDTTYGLGGAFAALGVLGVILAIPTDGISLTFSGGVAVVAGVSSALSGASLMGSQAALNSGNMKLSKGLQYASITLGLTALVAMGVSIAPAVNSFFVTEEMNVATQWFNTTGFWQKVVEHIPGARAIGSRIAFSDTPSGQFVDISKLSSSHWDSMLGPEKTIQKLAAVIESEGQVPKLSYIVPSALPTTLLNSSSATASVINGLHRVFHTSTYKDSEDTDSNSADSDKKHGAQASDLSGKTNEVMNWSEIRGSKNTHSPDKTHENDFSDSHDIMSSDLYEPHT